MHANTTATATNNSSRQNRLRKPDRSKGYFGSRDREIRTGSIARDSDEAILE
jgi:hypothetical protein